jgi:hypothetical protein
MPEFDSKLILVGVLMVALIIARFLAGNRFGDNPIRRRRRFGYKGTRGPLREQERADADATAVSEREAESGGKVIPLRDPEKEFFGEDEKRR